MKNVNKEGGDELVFHDNGGAILSGLRLSSVYIMLILIIGSGIYIDHVQENIDLVPSAIAFAGGNGTIENPYQVSNITQLQSVALDRSAHYVQIQDIDASETRNWNGGYGFEPIGPTTDAFQGVYNGQGYNITDLFINEPFGQWQGLFGYCFGAQICNVNLWDVNISTYNLGGGISGVARDNSNIMNCNVTGKLTGGSLVGGIVGSVYHDSRVSNCSFKGIITGGDRIGGISGNADLYGYTVRDCFFSGNLTGEDQVGGITGEGLVIRCSAQVNLKGERFVGGISGFGGAIESWSSGTIHGNSDVGGISGQSYLEGIGSFMLDVGSIIDCYSTADVSGEQFIGGITGRAISFTELPYKGSLLYKNSYSIGSVNGTSNVGGLLGNVSVHGGGSVTIVHSYWNKETSKQNISSGGEGRISYFMNRKANYENWDFDNIWDIKDGHTYPFFIRDYYNDPPKAHDDIFETLEDSVLLMDPDLILHNDMDIDVEDVLSIENIDRFSRSGVEISEDLGGKIVYDPTSTMKIQSLGPGQILVDSFNYTVSDGMGGSDNGTISIWISGLNDIPKAENDLRTIDQDGLLEIDVGSILSNDLEVDSDDSLDLLWIDKVSNKNSRVTWIGSTIRYYPSDVFLVLGEGEWDIDDIEYVVSDLHGGSSKGHIRINVTGSNDPPVILQSIKIDIEEDSGPFTFEGLDHILDMDDDSLSIVSFDTSDLGFLSLNGTSFTFFPYENSAGSEQISFMINDGNGGISNQTILITIIPINDRPMWTYNQPDLDHEEGNPLSFNNTAFDVDGDDMFHFLSVEPDAEIRIDPTTGTAFWKDPSPGIYTVNISASDGEFMIFDEVILTITEKESANDPPSVEPVSDQFVKKGETVILNLDITDREGDDISITLIDSPDGMVVTNDNRIVWATVNSDTGAHGINLSISDGISTVNLSFSIFVESNDVGDDDDDTQTLDDDERSNIKEKDETYQYVSLALGIVVLLLALLLIFVIRRKDRTFYEE